MDAHLERLERIARDAAALGVARFGHVASERKADGTVVTEADRAMQARIVAELRALEPDPRRLFLICEEERDEGASADLNPGVADPRVAEWVAAVDPLDGTASYASGLPLWCVSIGLLRQGRPVAGVVYAPLLGGGDGWLYRVGPEGAATRNGDLLAARPFDAWERVRHLGVPSGFHRWARVDGYRGKQRSLGSTAHHLCLVAAGGLDGAVIGRAHLWDLAAGAAILERAGGVLVTLAGAAPAWDPLLDDEVPREILVAASPALAAELGQRVRIHPRPGAGGSGTAERSGVAGGSIPSEGSPPGGGSAP